MTGRLGVRSEYTFTRESGGEIKPWLYFGVQDEVSNGTYVGYAGTDFDSQEYNFAANLQAGITADVNKHLQFYGDAGYTADFEDYTAWRLDAGLRVKW